MTTPRARVSLVVAAISLAAGAASADITLVGKASISGTATDLSGLTNVVGHDCPHNRLGCFGSAIDYTGKDNLYIAMDDRGPGDGEAMFRPRFQTFRILISPNDPTPVRAELVKTTLLTDEHGGPLWGYAGGYNLLDRTKEVRLDPEGVRVAHQADGSMSIWLSDEYGPWLDHYAMDGHRIRRLTPPDEFLVSTPSENPVEELGSVKGRESNRGFEGLAIKPDGHTLWAILQSPLIQDGGLKQSGDSDAAKKDRKHGPYKRVGVNNRILELDTATGTTREFVYVMESRKNGVNEIVAVNDHLAIVLERDGKSGVAAKHRALYLVDFEGATDVSNVRSLPSKRLPETITPVRKQKLLDFLDPKFGLGGTNMPEKIEGVTFGPNLPDGRRTLVVTTDNDMHPEEPSWFWVFALTNDELRIGGVSQSASLGEH